MAKKGDTGGESIQGYFKRIFRENRDLLKGRSNAEVLQRWLDDHPEQTEIPNSVKVGLQNAKSAMRSNRRKRRASRAQEEPAPQGEPRAKTAADGRKRVSLDTLEEQIDDCITEAKVLDREGLQDVIHHLRRARNAIVWKMGQ